MALNNNPPVGPRSLRQLRSSCRKQWGGKPQALHHKPQTPNSQNSQHSQNPQNPPNPQTPKPPNPQTPKPPNPQTPQPQTLTPRSGGRCEGDECGRRFHFWRISFIPPWRFQIEKMKKPLNSLYLSQLELELKSELIETSRSSLSLAQEHGKNSGEAEAEVLKGAPCVPSSLTNP